METKRTFISVLTGLLVICSITMAQPAKTLIGVNVAPQHGDWVYKPGETVKFDVSITKNNVLFSNIKEISYEFGPEMMPPVKTGKQALKDGKTVIDAGTMKTPGFLRCRVYVEYDGKKYEGVATAGFSPESIQPTTTLPADFVQFWDKAKSDLAKIPLDARLTLLPERCTSKTNVYHVNIQSYQNTRLYGILSVPKASGKYPAMLVLPGGGVRRITGDVAFADRGFVVLDIGIHGIPVNMEPGVYADLGRGALSGYMTVNLDDRDRYYFKRVYMGLVRAIDFIFSMPEFDGSNIAAVGGSQGGALSIVATGLDNRIKSLVAINPALCDLTGFLHGRAGGYPFLRNPIDQTPAKIETSKYYDVVNFARFVKVPGFYAWGFNDDVCPPTSIYAAYNVIQAPRTLFLMEEAGHPVFPETWSKSSAFTVEMLTIK